MVVTPVTVRLIVVEWLAPPEAVMVMVKVPVMADAEAANETVTVHVGLHGLFVNVGVTPEGWPEAENVTELVEPLVRVAVIEDEPLVPPWATVRLFGFGVERLKSKDTAVTVILTVVVAPLAVAPAGLAVTWTLYEPGATEDAIAMVRTLVAPVDDGVTEDGLNDVQVMPEGRGVTQDSVTD